MLENIIMATPGLSQDPVAVAIIRDPELLVHMGDVATIRKCVPSNIISIAVSELLDAIKVSCC
jgi:hypothetical protein